MIIFLQSLGAMFGALFNALLIGIALTAGLLLAVGFVNTLTSIIRGLWNGLGLMDELTLLRNIAQAAKLVRDRQRNYFRLRTTEMLQLSKSAEAHLDKLLTQYQAGNYSDQVDLFADPSQPP